MPLPLLVPIGIAALGMASKFIDNKAANDATISNVASMGDSMLYSVGAKQNTMNEMDRVMGDKLSASGLESLKREARLRASAAETGTSGGTTTVAVNEAYSEKLMRDSQIIRDSRIQKDSMRSSMVADILSFENQSESLISGIPSDLSNMLNVFGAGAQGFASGLNFLDSTGKQSALGVDQGR